MARMRAAAVARAEQRCGTVAAARRRPSPAARLAARAGHVDRRLRHLDREERRFRGRGFYEEALEVARERRYWEFVRVVIAEQRGRIVPFETHVVH